MTSLVFFLFPALRTFLLNQRMAAAGVPTMAEFLAGQNVVSLAEFEAS